MSTTVDGPVLQLVTSKRNLAQAAVDSLQTAVSGRTQSLNVLEGQITTTTANLMTVNLKTRSLLKSNIKELQRNKFFLEVQQKAQSSELSTKKVEVQKLQQEVLRATELQEKIKARQAEITQLQVKLGEKFKDPTGTEGKDDDDEWRNKNLDEQKLAKGGGYCKCSALVYGSKTTYKPLNPYYVKGLSKDKYDSATKLPKPEERSKMEADTSQIALYKKNADRVMQPDRIWFEEKKYEYTESFDYMPGIVVISVKNRKEPITFKTLSPPTPCTSSEECEDDCNAKLTTALTGLSWSLYNQAADDVKGILSVVTGERVARKKAGVTYVAPPDRDEQWVGIEGICIAEEESGLK